MGDQNRSFLRPSGSKRPSAELKPLLTPPRSAMPLCFAKNSGGETVTMENKGHGVRFCLLRVTTQVGCCPRRD